MIVTKIAYGRLKARWRHLLSRNDMNFDDILHVITSAYVLHNINFVKYIVSTLMMHGYKLPEKESILNLVQP